MAAEGWRSRSPCTCEGAAGVTPDTPGSDASIERRERDPESGPRIEDTLRLLPFGVGEREVSHDRGVHDLGRASAGDRGKLPPIADEPAVNGSLDHVERCASVDPGAGLVVKLPPDVPSELFVGRQTA